MREGAGDEGGKRGWALRWCLAGFGYDAVVAPLRPGWGEFFAVLMGCWRVAVLGCLFVLLSVAIVAVGVFRSVLVVSFLPAFIRVYSVFAPWLRGLTFATL